VSSFADAFTALKNVILLQERLERTREDISGLSKDVGDLNDYVVSVDKRVIRIETLIEMTARQPGSGQKRIDK
jgi:hypothetical protein